MIIIIMRIILIMIIMHHANPQQRLARIGALRACTKK